MKIRTVRATWPDGVVMLFGTTYRKWRDQLDEYLLLFKRQEPSLEVSDEPWISYGGIKWCAYDNLAEELRKEGQGRTVDQFAFRAITPDQPVAPLAHPSPPSPTKRYP